MRLKQLQRKNEALKEVALHIKRMREQKKQLFNNKLQVRRIFLNVDNLMLKYNIQFKNKHDFKFVFR